MAIDQPLGAGGELGVQRTTLTHVHQLEIRAAEAYENALGLDAQLFLLATQPSSQGVDQLHIAVNQGGVRAVLKICAFYFHNFLLIPPC